MIADNNYYSCPICKMTFVTFNFKNYTCPGGCKLSKLLVTILRLSYNWESIIFDPDRSVIVHDKH